MYLAGGYSDLEYGHNLLAIVDYAFAQRFGELEKHAWVVKPSVRDRRSSMAWRFLVFSLGLLAE